MFGVQTAIQLQNSLGWLLPDLTQSGKQYVDVTDQDELLAGEIVYVRVKCKYDYLWPRAIVASVAEAKINATGHFEMINVNYSDDPQGYFWFKIRVLGTPVLLLILAIAGVVVAGLAVFETPTILRLVRDIEYQKTQQSIFDSAASGNVTLDDALSAQEAMNEQQAKLQSGLGSQIEKAGMGLALPLIALAILYFIKQR